MICAGCPEGGVVLDPFMGAGTTAMVAKYLNRNYIGIELNPKYIKIAEKRLSDKFGMFLSDMHSPEVGKNPKGPQKPDTQAKDNHNIEYPLNPSV